MRRARPRFASTAGLFVLALLLHCESPSAPLAAFPFTVRALTDADEPVPGVVVSGAGLSGRTGPDGWWRGVVSGRDGEQVHLRLDPPSDHRALGPTSVPITLQVAAPLASGRPAPHPAQVTLRLAPPVRRYAVLVWAEGRGGQAILANGIEQGRTDAWGAATLLHRGKPGSRLLITMPKTAGARTRGELRRDFVLPDRDDILLIDAAAPGKRPDRWRHNRVPHPRARPRRGG